MQRNRTNKRVYDLLENKYCIPKKHIDVLKSLSSFKDTFKPDNIFLYGESGTGKTLYSVFCAFDLLKNIRIPIMGNTIVFLSISEFLVALKNYYKKSQVDHTYKIITTDTDTTTFEERLMNKCKSANLLILDDIGAGKSTDWTNEILYSVINNRYINSSTNQRTIITSNYTPDTLKTKIDSRITSRIFDMCNVSLFKKQYRKL